MKSSPISFRLTWEAQNNLSVIADIYKISKNKLINLLLTELARPEDRIMEYPFAFVNILENYYEDLQLNRIFKNQPEIIKPLTDETK